MRRACTALLTVFLLAASVSAQITLNANPPPANNGGSAGWAMFMDLTAVLNDLAVTHITTASTATAGQGFNIEIFTRVGTALGGPVGVGPGSSPAGWTSLGIVPATQGATSGGVSLPIDIPDIALSAGQLTGVAIRFTGVGPRYLGTGTPPLQNFTDGNLTLVTGDARSAPFTTGGSFFTSRGMVGSLTYIPEPLTMGLLGALMPFVLRRR